MDIKKIQIGLLEWFKFQQNASQKFYSIDNIAKKLFEQFYPNENSINAKYKIIYPLLRYGVLEFYGNKEFSLSPSCVLYNDDFILTCNIPDKIKQNLFNSILFESELGIEVFKITTDSLNILRNNSVHISKFSFINLLKQILPFEKTIVKWTKDIVFDTTGFQYYTEDYKWISIIGSVKNGIYKKSLEVYSQRTIKINNDDWYIIPSRDTNIDAFNIAVSWAVSNRLNSVRIKYYKSCSKLIIENINFPLIIERILFLNTLISGRFEYDLFNNKYQRSYYISQGDFNYINNLFNNKIAMYE